MNDTTNAIDIHGDKLYLYCNKTNIIDIFNLDGTFIKSFKSPAVMMTGIKVLEENKYLCTISLVTQGHIEKCEFHLIIFSNSEILYKTKFPLEEFRDKINALRFLQPIQKNKKIILFVENLPKVLIIDLESKETEWREYNYKNLAEIEEQLRSDFDPDNPIPVNLKMQRFLRVVEISEGEKFFIFAIHEKEYYLSLVDIEGNGTDYQIDNLDGNNIRSIAHEIDNDENKINFYVSKRDQRGVFKYSLPLK